MRRVFIVGLCLAVGCLLRDNAQAQSAMAANAVPQIVPPIGPLLATADPATGEAYAKKVCVVCHSLNEGGKPIVGPNLYGVVGGPHARDPRSQFCHARPSPALQLIARRWSRLGGLHVRQRLGTV
jgi:cytochrome c2